MFKYFCNFHLLYSIRLGDHFIRLSITQDTYPVKVIGPMNWYPQNYLYMVARHNTLRV